MESTDAISTSNDRRQAFQRRVEGREVVINALVLDRVTFGPHDDGLKVFCKGGKSEYDEEKVNSLTLERRTRGL